MVNKAQIRKEVSTRVAELDEGYKRQVAEKIRELVCALKEFITARVIMSYLAKEDEVDTKPIIETAVREGKEVVVPVMENGEIKPCKFKEPLGIGQYGIKEPLEKEWVDPEEIDLVLVPGRAFDLAGNRIGRGGGHYDRFLSRLPAGVPKIGICFACQLYPSLPVGPADVRVDRVVSA